MFSVTKSDSADKRPRREKSWCGLVIHHTAISGQVPTTESLWRRMFSGVSSWLSKKDDTYASAHYLIGRFGEIIELVDPNKFEAFHAGKSEYWHPLLRKVVPDWNRYAIGIELLGDGNKTMYSDVQYQALAWLCRDLKKRYPTIHPQAIVGHEQVSPGRKIDPGKFFDWEKFFKAYYVG